MLHPRARSGGLEPAFPQGGNPPGRKGARKEEPALRPITPVHEPLGTRRAGVSLLAILVTLAVIALLAGLAIPFWFGRHEVTLDNAAVLLSRDLRAVQNRAAFLGEPVQVQFHEHGWEAIDHAGAPLSRYGDEEPVRRRLDADGVFEGVTVRAIRFGDDDAISFGSRGEALEEGSLELHFRGERRRLEVSAPHGEVLILGLARPGSDDGR